MFQSVRPNSQIYILYKGDSPRLEVGYATNQAIPRQKYNLSSPFNAQEMVVDIIVKSGEQTFNYTNIPAQADVADTFSNGESIIIADSRDAINSELMNLKQKSQDIIDSIDIHKNMLVAYDSILANLNPEFAEKRAQQEEISSLKNQMSDMSKSLEELMATNKLLIERLSANNIKL